MLEVSEESLPWSLTHIHGNCSTAPAALLTVRDVGHEGIFPYRQALNATFCARDVNWIDSSMITFSLSALKKYHFMLLRAKLGFTYV